jgi:predicted O-methyltransferase YrrM
MDHLPPTHIEYATTAELRESHAEIKLKALHLMDQMNGWCSAQKGTVLVDLVLKSRPKTIVEIGVFGGKSVIPMAYALKVLNQGTIYGIDPWSSFESTQWVTNEQNRHYWSTIDHEAVLQGLIQKIDQFDLKDQIVLIRNSSADAPIIENIDILHIDGNHSEETSYLDVTKWVPLVKSGGWIIFDDMTWYENGKFTTSKATEWLDTNCVKFAEYTDSCIWGIWVKP